MDEASRALRHVHNKVDAEAQWERAVGRMGDMTALQIAQTWQALAESVPEDRATIVLSQLKALFKGAIQEARRRSCQEERHKKERDATQQDAVILRQQKEIKKLKETKEEMGQALQETARELFRNNQEIDRLHARLEEATAQIKKLSNKSTGIDE